MPEPFLSVSSSLLGRRWVERLDDAQGRVAQAIAQRGIASEIVARIIAGRDVGLDVAETYLNPTIRDLMPDPSSLADMDRLAERLVSAITDNEKVALFGDYDVDGAASCALMARYLRHFGLEPEIYIPDRIFEGYGPNIAAMDKLIDNGASLIVTLDCGTVSDDPSPMPAAGADVLVIDHHSATRTSPRPMRWSIRTGPTTFRGSATCAPRASPSWCWSPSTASCASAAIPPCRT